MRSASGCVDRDLSDTSRIDVTVVDEAAVPRAGHAVALEVDGLVHEQVIEDVGLGDPPELEVLVN